MEIITNFFNQMLFTVGVVVAFGLLIAVCRRGFCRIVGYNGPKILLITGAVGTPIHELGHALMCLIFGHRIDEIRLFDPDDENGTLGYVSHSYNSRNIYHQIGNFFIGVAPVLCGSGVLILLMRLLVPDVFFAVSGSLWASSSFSFGAVFATIGAIFSFSNFGNILWWLFIILALMISSHMELSMADIKGGLVGLGFIAGALLAVDAVLYLVAPSLLVGLTSAITSFALPIASFLMISGIFSLLMIVIALIIKGVGRILGR